MTDTTLVTGGPGGRAPREGEVLGDRYEIAETISSDALAATFRAIDREDGAPISLRVAAAGLLSERDARAMIERLRPLVGVGGRVLSPLRAVEREASAIYTIEPWPNGASLRSLLAARRTLDMRALVPIVARLGAALASIPEPHWHGDVRSERVWIEGDEVTLVGGLLMPALPGETVAQVLARSPELRRGLAPEVSEGLGGRASDRWGVAAIAWEALTGRAPGHEAVEPPAELGVVGAEIARLLHPDPSARPATLDALLNALCAATRLPVPRVEPDESAPLAAAGLQDPDETTLVGALGATDPSQRLSTIPAPPPEGSEPPTDPARAVLRPPPVPTVDDASVDVWERARTDPRMSPPPIEEPGSDLDPRLVRAALAPDSEPISSGELELVAPSATVQAGAAQDGVVQDIRRGARGEELDPRLVRAALGVSLDAAAKPPPKPAGVTQELGSGDLEEMRASAKRAIAAPPPPSAGASSSRPPSPPRPSAAEATPGARRESSSIPPPRAGALAPRPGSARPSSPSAKAALPSKSSPPTESSAKEGAPRASGPAVSAAIAAPLAARAPVRTAADAASAPGPASPPRAAAPASAASTASTSPASAVALPPPPAPHATPPTPAIPPPAPAPPIPTAPEAAAAPPIDAPPVRRRPLKDPEPVPLPTDIKPIPRPRTRDSSGEMQGPVLFDASAPRPATVVGALPNDRPPPVLLIAAHEPSPSAMRESARKRQRSTAARGSWVSWIVILSIASLMSAGIIGAGYWYRSVLQRQREREQRIEQRLRELQRATPTTL